MSTTLNMTKGERQALINSVKSTWISDHTQTLTINLPTRNTQDDVRRVKEAVAGHMAALNGGAVTYSIPNDPNG